MNEHISQQQIVKKFEKEANDSHVIERTKKQEHTIAIMAQSIERLGLWDDLYLLGGFASRARKIKTDRGHEDIDFIIKGRDSAKKIIADILASNEYEIKENPELVGTSVIHLVPKGRNELEFLDIRWVNEEKGADGSSIYVYELPPDFSKLV